MKKDMHMFQARASKKHTYHEYRHYIDDDSTRSLNILISQSVLSTLWAILVIPLDYSMTHTHTHTHTYIYIYIYIYIHSRKAQVPRCVCFKSCCYRHVYDDMDIKFHIE